MINLKDLLLYLPESHGEHGVDAALHMLCMDGGPLHEVFTNPPGGSWTQFDLLRPCTDHIYRWDHIPRAPTASVKRPDLVLQLNVRDVINLLSLESKLNYSAVEPNMAEKLMRYFDGGNGFTGLKQKPAWHSLKGGNPDLEVIEGISSSAYHWKVIAPDSSDDERYWFRDYPQEKISYWSGFAYALSPEVYTDTTAVNKERIEGEISVLLKSQPDLDVVIAVGWVGLFHDPFLIRKYSERFHGSKMAEGLETHLCSAIIN